VGLSPNSTLFVEHGAVGAAWLNWKISSEAYSIATMMKSTSSIVSTFCDWGLVAWDFFRVEGFYGQPFLSSDVSASVRGSFGGVTSPLSFLSSSPSSSWFTSSPPPSAGESDAVSFDALFFSSLSMSYTSSFFFFLFVLLGPSYSISVTNGLSMMLGLKISACSTGTRNSAGHSLVISSMSSSVNL
jgi:hypothetical protein